MQLCQHADSVFHERKAFILHIICIIAHLAATHYAALPLTGMVPLPVATSGQKATNARCMALGTKVRKRNVEASTRGALPKSN